MHTSRGNTQKGRLQALRAKHEHLSKQIEEEQKHPSTSDIFLRQLKSQRLRIKEEIEGAAQQAG